VPGAALFIVMCGSPCFAQSPEPRAGAVSAFIPLNEPSYHIIERGTIRQCGDSLAGAVFTAIKPTMRSELLHVIDSEDMGYLGNEAGFPRSRNPVLKHFYRTPAHLFHVDVPDFQLAIDPVLDLKGGFERGSGEFKYNNTRGVEVEGVIAKRVGFYSYVGENQGNFMEYVHDRIDDNFSVMPGEGRVKLFKDNPNVVDFLSARGYVTVRPIKQILVQFGQDKNFIGSGHRSLLLSDYGKDYFFLKLNTRVWKLNYQNLYTELIDYRAVNEMNDAYIPRKYAAFHTLSVNITPGLNVALFEGTLFAGQDSAHRSFELQYLNPIILYRTIEYQSGSSGNVILGLDAHWNFLHRFQLYSQVVLDDIVWREMLNGTGWWGNKYGLQLGAKYINVAGIRNLDLQLETNMVRPYTYSHDNEIVNYSNFHQPLAHPLGANFKEGVAIIRYRPLSKLFIKGTLITAIYGTDDDSTNYGSNIFLPNTDRPHDYGNISGQGYSTKLLYCDFLASWMLFHNAFLDLQLTVRNSSSSLDTIKGSYGAVGFRMNIPERRFEF
jgi:hypothetical protein